MVSHSLDHLHTGVWSFLDESPQERITRLYAPKWVSYVRGNEALARMSLNQLKFLSNELRMSMVALGTSEALYAMQTDPQIASRFEPFGLPRWKESAELRAFVVSFGRLLPLEKPSALASKEMIQKLMAYSNGLTGKISSLLAQSAELAIRHKTESINLELVEEAAASGIYKLPAREEAEEA